MVDEDDIGGTWQRGRSTLEMINRNLFRNGGFEAVAEKV